MSYGQKFKESSENAHRHHIATKIRTLMGILRKSADENRKRRWVWELLQNAKDASFDDQSVIASINYTPDAIEFSHNGKPFSVEDVTFLAEQVSTKDQKVEPGEKPKKTGKFGTGFLTTHLLSEKVEVNGVIKDIDEPYKKFILPLDRSGREIEEILTSVGNSLALLKDLDSQPILSRYNRGDLNTRFVYHLDEKGTKVAEIGLVDLETCIAYALVFNESIREVRLAHTNTTFSVNDNPIIIDDIISIYNISIGENSKHIVVAKKGLTSIAIEVEATNGTMLLRPFNKSVPKLFCDFPLIGSETFSFPLVINNPTFSPTEPRDGVDLTDNDDIDIIRNKEFVNEAIELYTHFVEYASASGWKNMYLLADFKLPTEKNWLSVDWFRNSVVGVALNRIRQIPLVDMSNGTRSAIQDADGHSIVYFPDDLNEDVRKRIWELTVVLFPKNLPRLEDIHDWYSVLWEECYRQNLGCVTIDVEELKTVEALANKLDGRNEAAIKWLNHYFDTLNLQGIFIEEIINNKHAVIPNQNNHFKKRSELSIDDSIEDSIKEAAKILGMDPKDGLRLKSISTEGRYDQKIERQIRHSNRTQDDIVTQINSILKEGKNPNIHLASAYLTALYANDSFFPEHRNILDRLSRTIFDSEFFTQPSNKLSKWTESIWSESDKIQIKRLVTEIADTKSAHSLMVKYGFDQLVSVYSYLNEFVEYLTTNGYDSQLNLKTLPILPNQNGDFKIKDELMLDNGEIPGVLKDVANDLGYDFRIELLVKDIFLELPENRTVDIGQVADKIISLISSKFSEVPRTDQTRRSFKSLVFWFIENKEQAAMIFKDLYINKHKLYDDEEIIASFQKSEAVGAIMTEFGFSSVFELRKAIIAGIGPKKKPKKPITRETLVQLGVTSVDELAEALKDIEVSEAFIHESKPTVEMFLYAQSLIERAKENVIMHLQELPEYDCSDLEILAHTIIGGVRKNGAHIHIVVRPSDHNEVIIYYSSEKDTLELADSELWIDNGRESPAHLTLGKVIRNIGINRIPV
jgi:hypothetical protein